MRALSLPWSRIEQREWHRAIAVALWSSALALLLVANARGESCIDYQDYIHHVGHVNLSGGNDVVVVGGLAYVVGGGRLHVVDIASPSLPAIMSQISVGIGANAVVIEGTRAYIAAGMLGLEVVDISNPEAPFIIGTADTPGNARDVAVDGNYCVIADETSLIVLDISNPQAPQIVGSMLGVPVSVVLSGLYAYVASGGLQVIDLSNPAMPLHVANAPISGQALDVALAGGLLYVATSIGLAVVDVSTPTAPDVLGTAQIGSSGKVAVAESTAFIVANDLSGTTRTVDISNPLQPTMIGAFGMPRNPRGVAMAGEYAYVGVQGTIQNPSSLWILDLSNPRSPEPLNEAMNTGHRASGVALAGNYALLAFEEGGLLAFDVTDPSAPTFRWVVSTPGTAVDVIVSGNHAYVAADDGGLHVVDISIPIPAIVGSVPGNNIFGVAVAGSHAYVAAGSSGLLVVDVSTPGSPVVVGSANTPGGANKVAVAGNYAYVADGSAGLTIVNVSNPTSPVITASLDTGAVVDVAVEGTYAYVVDRVSGLQAIDVSNPVLPSLVGAADTPTDALGVTIVDDYAYVMDTLHFQLVDISDPSSMSIVGAAHTGACDAAVAGGYVYVAAHFDHCLRIFPAQCPASLGIEEPASAVSPSALLAQNHPNPFARTTSISFAMPPAVDEGSLEVYDALGRQVRVLAKGEIAVGRHAITWDGRDNRGARVPAGVYFYRLTAGTYQEEKKMVVLSES